MDLSSVMDAMSLDSFGAQSYMDNNLLNTEYQAPEYAIVSWDTAGRRHLMVKMALFCLCLMAAGGATNIDFQYPPLDSWTRQGWHRFVHNASGFMTKRLPPNATIVETDAEERQPSHEESLEFESLEQVQPAHNESQAT